VFPTFLASLLFLAFLLLLAVLLLLAALLLLAYMLLAKVSTAAVAPLCCCSIKKSNT
jgi:hypothetical protein